MDGVTEIFSDVLYEPAKGGLVIADEQSPVFRLFHVPCSINALESAIQR
jgi:hypothetical protein